MTVWLGRGRHADLDGCRTSLGMWANMPDARTHGYRYGCRHLQTPVLYYAQDRLGYRYFVRCVRTWLNEALSMLSDVYLLINQVMMSTGFGPTDEVTVT